MRAKNQRGRDTAAIKTEAIAGLTTFLTMAYIVVVNPAILATEGTGMPFSGVMTATVMSAALGTLLMGLYARLPYALAPGMGINAFFTYSLVLGQGIPWETALGVVVWSGVLFLAASATPLRAAMARAVPHSLRSAAAAGIGLFLTFIGLRNAGLVAADPVTFVKPGELGIGALAALIGGITIVWLYRRKSPLAFLTGITASAVFGWAAGGVAVPERLFSTPDFSLFGRADLSGAFQLALVPALLTLLFTDLFDSLSTFLGVAQAADLVDGRGEPVRLKEGLLVDAAATLISGIFGTSSATTYIESGAGIKVGGRTGRTAVFAALCFLPCLFLAPVAGAIPAYASAPVLIFVGLFMFQTVREIEMEKIEEALPAFLTIVLIPLSFSITQGILWGLLSHTGLYVISGRRKELSLAMVSLALISALLLGLQL